MRRRVETPGSALVLALWLALLLGVAGIAATRLAATGAGAARLEADLARARAAAEGGIWAAAHQLATLPRQSRPHPADFAFAPGGVPVVVRATDEDGRLDLNAAPEALLAALFAAAGLPPGDAATLAARVVAWREPDRQGLGPFRSAAELGAVPGFDRALAEALRPAVTVHSGRSRPAAEAAPPLVRGLLPEAPRGGLPLSRGLRPGVPQALPGSGRRSIWRLEAEARSGAATARLAAVMDLSPVEGMPGRVLEWRPAGH
ncbi:type II secretion system protein GspK [Siccirubricoccus sp. G192]|uniref:type II secretion system protein GspK n=1 Tax=Siccirubricoccus sp. G192 TaxID=2849651 RepID=UPI001C2CC258|nr:type II secretion system protein GspK [Siccirubricoccus sp. G192]MBV1800153.1 helix-hairpin-helix domain-containing protein [Siccirubricoccus sp. G192]